jgi:hypothetical protein
MTGELEIPGNVDIEDDRIALSQVALLRPVDEDIEGGGMCMAEVVAMVGVLAVVEVMAVIAAAVLALTYPGFDGPGIRVPGSLAPPLSLTASPIGSSGAKTSMI